MREREDLERGCVSFLNEKSKNKNNSSNSKVFGLRPQTTTTQVIPRTRYIVTNKWGLVVINRKGDIGR